MASAADMFRGATDLLLSFASRTITVTKPDGTVKYTTRASSGVWPRANGAVNSYDQERVQFTHPAAAGEPEKFDMLVIDGAPRAIEEVRPQRVGEDIVNYRIIVKG